MSTFNLSLPNPCCVAIGIFDGVHLGHRRILAALAEASRRYGATPVAVTFDPHPRELFTPEQAPPLLLPLAWRRRYLLEAGAAEVAVVPFTREFAALSREEFLGGLLAGGGVRAIVVGRGWRFGRGGGGDAAFLTREAATGGFEFIAVEELELDGSRVSSSVIRHRAAAGQLDMAAALLGRPYAVYGRVESGFQAAGRELRHPTANLALTGGVMPPDGVYAGRALGHPAAINIGISPTYGHLNHHRRRFEAHLLDFSGDLYGREIEVELLEFLREERTFPGPEELRRQIESDIQRIRRRAAAATGEHR